MSDEMIVPVEDVVEEPIADMPTKPKQYLLMADEATMIFMGKLMPSMLFVQVEGIAMQGSAEYMVLVNPVKKPEAAVE